MFKSSVAVGKLVEDLRNEVDIALPIPNHTYLEWLNSLEQLLYSEIIQEQKEYILKNPENTDIAYASMAVEGDRVRFEDIVAVFVNDVQLIKSSVLSGQIFPNCYYKKDEDNLGLNVYIQPEDTIEKIRVIYRPRPKLKEVKGDNETISADDYVMLPEEFVELARAKLRGEAYKLANEDLLAAKWLNEYNVMLENFRVWIAEKQSTFGL